MTTRVELLVDRIETARFIPLESVFEKAGRRYCWVLQDGEPEVREILTGPSNDNHIVIEAGLEAGERILLREPTEGGRSLGGAGTTDFLDIVSPSSSPSPDTR
jgi:hypothetical protein